MGLHLVSAASTGFQAAIAMSGSATTPADSSSGGVVSERSQVEPIRKLARRFDCLPSTADVIYCMRNVNPVEVLVEYALSVRPLTPDTVIKTRGKQLRISVHKFQKLMRINANFYELTLNYCKILIEIVTN